MPKIKVPGLLAHGTSAKRLTNILKGGLRPRGRAKSLWPEHPSIADHVYLTNAYALYFARNAVEGEEDALMIEIDPDSLKSVNLYPDEDAIAQVIQGDNRDPRFKGTPLGEATKQVRDRIKAFNRDGYSAAWSMAAIGNCAHEGLVPVRAIKSMVVLKNPLRSVVTMFSDPSITVTNYHFCGSYYREFQAWLLRAGEGPMPKMESEAALAALEPEWRERRAKAFEEASEALRGSLEIVYRRPG